MCATATIPTEIDTILPCLDVFVLAITIDTGERERVKERERRENVSDGSSHKSLYACKFIFICIRSRVYSFHVVHVGFFSSHLPVYAWAQPSLIADCYWFFFFFNFFYSAYD